MAERRARAYQDLRMSKEGKQAKPAALQMLFSGGSVERGLATEDLRMGRRENIRPNTSRMLFKGGPARAVASEDLRMDHDGEDEIEPGNRQMLSDGGEAEDGDLTEEQCALAEDVLDAMGGFGYGDKISEEHDTEPEKAGKRASRRAKAELLGQALKAFFRSTDDD